MQQSEVGAELKGAFGEKTDGFPQKNICAAMKNRCGGDSDRIF
jgi:hypothetical protein